MNRYKQHSQAGQATAAIVGVIALIALVIGWIAYNRSGDDLVADVSDQFATSTDSGDLLDSTATTGSNAVGGVTGAAGDEAQREVVDARADARARLDEVQTNLRTNQNYQAALTEVQEIEADLEAAYREATGTAAQQWTTLQEEFSQLENGLRAGTAGVLEAISNLSASLEADVRTDEDGASQ